LNYLGMTIQVLEPILQTATEQHRAGNLLEARRLYEQVLSVAPLHELALFRSGLLELQDGHPDKALVRIAQASAAAPDDARYRIGLGQTLQALCRWDEAAQAYEAALRLQPDFPNVSGSLGICLQRSGQWSTAAAAYRKALVEQPKNAAVMANLGTVLREMHQSSEAADLLRAASELEPLVASHAVNLGIALHDQRDFAAAERVLSQTLARHPHDADAAFNLGNALHALGRSSEAVDRYRRAVSLRADYVDALINLGNVQTELGDFASGLAAYDAALLARPESVVALNNAGCLMRTLGRIDEAETLLLRAQAVEPGHGALYDNLGNVYKDAGALDDAINCFRKALELDPAAAATHGNLAYALSFQSPSPQAILEECLRWNERFAAGLHPPLGAGAGGSSDTRGRVRADSGEARHRLKIGYVSPDFRDHCQSLFTIPLLSQHDHECFDITCYSSVKRPDSFTQRIAGYADVWRDVRPLDDETLCEVIREDGIDILVDLTMHMAGGRPLVFARRPAPVQIAWLAYPGTTGMSAIDYRLSDPRFDPEGYDAHYRERTLRLADSFWCYDPLTDGPEVSALPAIERGYPTFGCLNNPCKMTLHTLRLWGRVMRALPNARLVLMAPQGRHRVQLLQRLADQSIAADRIDFLPYQRREDYLHAYRQLDMGLDTFPYNGHTTSLDSLWMGVPVVTRVGNTSVGRGGLSQLFQLGQLDLAAECDDEFVSIAVALSKDLSRLAQLRAGLRSRMRQSPLMDAPRFARQIEGAYRTAWKTLAHRE
jgi:protein O-GlcNAc transferase